MQSAVLFINPLKKDAKELSCEICGKLESCGVKVSVCALNDHPVFVPEDKFDIAFSLGGDGTVLYAARILAAFRTPIIPVHLGTLGFLANVERNRWLTVYEQWQNKTIRISPRCMFEFSVERGDISVYNNICLNDLVIGYLGIAKLIRLRVKTEVAPNEFADLGYYRSDGLIIATPTGSTAYSMAAGGPIVDPEMEALIVNPICSFALSSRPLVLPPWQTLFVTVEKEQRSGVLLTIDGQDTFELEPEDRIIVRHSPHYARIITEDRSAYYSALKKKLSWGEPVVALKDGEGSNA